MAENDENIKIKNIIKIITVRPNFQIPQCRKVCFEKVEKICSGSFGQVVNALNYKYYSNV